MANVSRDAKICGKNIEMQHVACMSYIIHGLWRPRTGQCPVDTVMDAFYYGNESFLSWKYFFKESPSVWPKFPIEITGGGNLCDQNHVIGFIFQHAGISLIMI